VVPTRPSVYVSERFAIMPSLPSYADPFTVVVTIPYPVVDMIRIALDNKGCRLPFSVWDIFYFVPGSVFERWWSLCV